MNTLKTCKHPVPICTLEHSDEVTANYEELNSTATEEESGKERLEKVAIKWWESGFPVFHLGLRNTQGYVARV